MLITRSPTTLFWTVVIIRITRVARMRALTSTVLGRFWALLSENDDACEICVCGAFGLCVFPPQSLRQSHGQIYGQIHKSPLYEFSISVPCRLSLPCKWLVIDLVLLFQSLLRLDHLVGFFHFSSNFFIASKWLWSRLNLVFWSPKASNSSKE